MTPGDGVRGSLFEPLGTGLEVHFLTPGDGVRGSLFDPLGTGLGVHFGALRRKMNP